jgi:hypothetical protein
MKGYKAIGKIYNEKPITLVENRNEEDLVVIISKTDCTSCVEYLLNIAAKYSERNYAIYILNNEYPQLDIMNNRSISNNIIKYDSPFFNHIGKLYHTPLLLRMNQKNAHELIFISPSNLTNAENNFKELALKD